MIVRSCILAAHHSPLRERKDEQVPVGYRFGPLQPLTLEEALRRLGPERLTVEVTHDLRTVLGPGISPPLVSSGTTKSLTN